MRQTRCQECGYVWLTKSKLRFVSCPSCLIKVPNFPNNHKEVHKKKDGDTKSNED